VTTATRWIAFIPLLASVASVGSVGTAGTAGSVATARPPAAQAPPVVIASKPFAESYLLAEMFAQLLEAHGIAVERHLGLGATELAFGALRTGEIDVYPEYTGTGLLAILGDTLQRNAREVYRHVATVFAQRWDVHWLPPLGFENTYAIAVRRGTADSLHLATLADLAREAPNLTAGLSPDFIGRADGLPALQHAYGIQFRAVRSLLQAVKYQALESGDVDVIDGYSTDGKIARYDLVVLHDVRGIFPPYEAAALVSSRLWHQRQDAIAVLTLLSGRLDASTMRRWNARIEVDGVAVPEVARDALAELQLTDTVVSERTHETRASRGFLSYLWSRRTATLHQLGRHLLLVAVSLVAAILCAVPLGLALERRRGAAEGTIRAVGLLQTIPGIALLAFMLPLLGIGVMPALVALFLYSLLPILRNTYTGVRDAAPTAVEAATALGMTAPQVLRDVRLPLAAPVIMAGIRTAAVINVGTATLAAFIGAGGLGDPIVSGLALADTRMVLSGAIPAALLALVLDLVLGSAEALVRPRGGVAHYSAMLTRNA
jgi:osmoprotectant transport system permease protein